MGVGRGSTPGAPRLNERLDHWLLAVGYAVSWAAVRAYLWRDGKVLRRQYAVRQLRVAERAEAKRRAR